MKTRRILGKITKISIIIILIGAVLYGILAFAVGMYAVMFSDIITKDDMDNPYINSDFEGFKPTEVEQWKEMQFMIPNNWNILEDEKILTVQNEHKQTIAYALAVSEETQAKDIFSKIEGTEITEKRYEISFPAVNFAEGILEDVLFCSSLGEKEYRRIRLNKYSQHHKHSSIHIVFPSDLPVSDDSLEEIAEVIIYSFSYPHTWKE